MCGPSSSSCCRTPDELDRARTPRTRRERHVGSDTVGICERPIDDDRHAATERRCRLFDCPEAELALLKQAVEAAIANYVAGLPPADERHPLLRHRDAALTITGSWSVRLTGSGRHVSHIHPLGLIGSAC